MNLLCLKRLDYIFFKCTTIQKISSALEKIFPAVMKFGMDFKDVQVPLLAFHSPVLVQTLSHLMSWESCIIFSSAQIASLTPHIMEVDYRSLR